MHVNAIVHANNAILSKSFPRMYEQPDDNASFDVVVIGSGGGGLAAAVTAACKGLRVAVLESAPVFGGTTAISGGGTWIPCNHLAANAGIVDTRDAAIAYFRHCVAAIGGRLNEPLVNAFLDNGPAMLEFFERNTDVRFMYAAGRPDYRPDAPGAAKEGRTIHPLPFDARALGGHVARLKPPSPEMTFLGMMIKPGPELKHFLNVFRSWESTLFVTRKLARHFRDLAIHRRGMDLSNGNALIGRLAKSALDHGAKIFTSVEAIELVRDGDRVGAVRFRAARADGKAMTGTVTATRGVVLASGGWPHDLDRRRQLYRHAPTGAEHRSPAPPTNTGRAQRMAESIGARFESGLAHPACWSPVSVVPKPGGEQVPFPHLIDRQKPGFIAVTRRGARFVNEANSYHDFGAGLIRACAQDAEAFAWLVADHPTIRRYGIGAVKPAPIPIGAHLESGYLQKAATLRELATRCAIDIDAFERTVVEFNRHAADGRDPEFGRGDNIYNRYNGDPGHSPNPCVAPIAHPPFYAVKVHVGELGTLAGLAVDTDARVLDCNGAPIAGLYAAGNDVASIQGGDYLSGGSTIGPGMTFGYIAGCHMAQAG